MKRIDEIGEFIEGAGSLIKLVDFCFEKGMLVCHPLVPVAFLPEGLKRIPKEAVKTVKMRNIFLYSKDGKKWDANPDELIKGVLNGEKYYISDLNLDSFFEVEEYMLEALVDLFNRDLPIVYSESYHWESEFLGEVSLIKFEDYFEGIAL